MRAVAHNPIPRELGLFDMLPSVLLNLIMTELLAIDELFRGIIAVSSRFNYVVGEILEHTRRQRVRRTTKMTSETVLLPISLTYIDLCQHQSAGFMRSFNRRWRLNEIPIPSWWSDKLPGDTDGCTTRETTDPTFRGYHFKGMPGRAMRDLKHRLVPADPSFNTAGRAILNIVQWSEYEWFSHEQNIIRRTLIVENVLFEGATRNYRGLPNVRIETSAALIFTNCCFPNLVRINMWGGARLDFSNVTFCDGVIIIIRGNAVKSLSFEGTIGSIRILDYVNPTTRIGGVPTINWRVRRSGVDPSPPSIEFKYREPSTSW